MNTIQTRAPSKPWRVTWPSLVTTRPNSEDYRSKNAAYEAVESITRLRLRATVEHWVSGTWVLYEICEPAVTATGTTEEN
jgi:hypothetical protein